MSDLQLGVEVDDISQVLRQLATIKEAQEQLGAATETANRRAAASSAQATNALAGFATRASTAVQRIQGVAGAIQGLVSALGSDNHTAGLAASLAGNTAQFAAMGSMLGPAGTVIGGIVGLVGGIGSLVSSEREAAEASEELANRIERVEERALTAGERIAQMNSALDRTVELSGINLGVASDRAYAAEIERVNTELEPLLARVEALHAGGVRGANASSMGGAGALLIETNNQIQALRDRAAELERLRSSANAEAIEIMGEDLAGAANRGRGGGSRRRGEQGVSRGITGIDTGSILNGTTQGDAAAARRGASASRVENDLAEADRAAARLFEIAREREEADRQSRERMMAMSTRHAEHERELLNDWKEAANDFSYGYVSSIDQVAEAWGRAQQASKAAHVDMMASSRLMERGMVAVGNNITETIGGRMTSAFEGAVGAWLDGSKSITEAADAMAKGIIRSLVQEGIVQAVTETARGIADLASYQYGTAALHFGAAAAWAAVAGVAGAVGAATGAFGGGAAQGSQGPSQRELADRNQSDRQGGGTTVINLYPGPLSTEDERANHLRRMLNYNAKVGRGIDRRLVA